MIPIETHKMVQIVTKYLVFRLVYVRKQRTCQQAQLFEFIEINNPIAYIILIRIPMRVAGR
jgi:hypothetical protein